MILHDQDYERCPWMAAANGSPTQVVSSRIRLARNLAGYPFSHWAGPRDLRAVAAAIKDAVARCPSLGNFEIIEIDAVQEADREFLAERQLISRELAGGGEQRQVVIREDQLLSVMINEEDHLRIQGLRPGLELRAIWEQVSQLDDELEAQLPYAFDPDFGYLTACPTNAGTGIRCSVMLHLPALVLCKKINRMLEAVRQIRFTVRGIGGEGTEIMGNLFQISNQQTLGVTEESQIEQIEKLVSDVAEWEDAAMEQLKKEASSVVEDKIWRAYGILQHARAISSLESSELISALRLGLHMGLLSGISMRDLNQVMICSGPGHLQKMAGSPLDTSERDRRRAEYIRGKIQLN